MKILAVFSTILFFNVANSELREAEPSQVELKENQCDIIGNHILFAWVTHELEDQ
ncbi:hypothetical protein [Autumnicola edwardsiae]|uniref:Uncharacterized protein n=1 Tax=Autumnicola edwardsiae TaxID=3075594 RepID=A0ABU3CVM1_9FLAO|nr:hypothetical protein [Zunongwangia sp. F297]MDT0650400.1 hypothetical protein [Zunongwangia sp. F297]